MLAKVLSSLLPGRHAKTYWPLDDFWYKPVGSPSSAGIVVKPDTAMAVSTVFACIRLLGESLGSLPWRVYQRDANDPRKSTVAQDHALWSVLHTRPNRWQSPIEFREMAVAHVCLRGNFYARGIISASGSLELQPLNPDCVVPDLQENGSVRYQWRRPGRPPVMLNEGEVFHVRGMTLDGVTGVSVLEYARHAVGSAIAQETHGASLFKNGGLPTFWISRPPGQRFTPEARKNFRASWRQLHGGAENAGNPPILEDGMELKELGLTNRDSQWIESRGFSAEEICRFFRVPAHLVGLKAAAAQGTVEQQGIEYVVYTVAPWAIRFEQAAQRDLFDEDTPYFNKLVLDGLLRGDQKSRYESYNIGVQGAWLTINEVRELEDRNPIEGGDTPRFPTNMQPAGGGPDRNEQGGQPGKGRPKAPAPDSVEEDDSPTAYEKRRGNSTAAFGPLVDDAARRIAAAEISGLKPRAGKAEDDRPRFDKWASGFYQRHHAYALQVVTPLVEAWTEAVGFGPLAAEVAADVAAMPGAIDADDVLALIDTWATTRAAEVAAVLLPHFTLSEETCL